MFFEFILLHRSRLTRELVLQHMSTLTTLSFFTLDYRRAYLDDTQDSEIVSDIAIESSVELLLKFTEPELRMYLGKLSEWKDLSVEAKERFPHARSVIFYKLLSKLGGTFYIRFMFFLVQPTETTDIIKTIII